MPAPLEGMMGLLSSVFRGGSPVTGDEALAARCAEHVAGNARLSPAAQVDIYRRQFWSRHIDALREDYAGLEFLLGEERFEAFCRAYLEAHPPASFTLRDLGCDLARFARSFGGFPEGRAEIARDMARYESALVEIFDGTEPPPLDPAKVQGVPEEAWSTARIALHPLLVRMPLGYPVHLLRADLKFGRTPSADVGRDSASAGPSADVGRDSASAGPSADVGRDSASAGPSIPSPRPVHLAVFRKDLIVRYEELDPAADALLDALGRGVPLVPACDAIAAGLDEAAGAALAARVGEWFAQWTSWGLIVDIER